MINQDDMKSSNTNTEYYKVQSDVRKQSNYMQRFKQCSDCVITGYKSRCIKNEPSQILQSIVCYQGTRVLDSKLCFVEFCGGSFFIQRDLYTEITQSLHCLDRCT